MNEATNLKANAALQFSKQAEKLSLQKRDPNNENHDPTTAVQARFITPQDPVIETASGERLPTVPLKEALELNRLRKDVEEPGSQSPPGKTEPGISGQAE